MATTSFPTLQTNVPGFPCRRGKVRDVYDLGDQLIIVATDRISAFDWVMPNGIPDKGRVLTALTGFWLAHLKIPNHLISDKLESMPAPFAAEKHRLEGRTMLVRKTRVVPVECVVRGYLSGSGWKDYQKTGAVCGVKLPVNLQESQQLPEPIFTPTTKEEHGHDQSLTREQIIDVVGKELADELSRRSIDAYMRGAEFARTRGIIIADTKFEWGHTAAGELLLIDEVLTPDSSRFWPVDSYRPGGNPPSFDKQFVRDWLETTGWDKNSPPPALPEDVVARTREKYLEALERITGRGSDNA